MGDLLIRRARRSDLAVLIRELGRRRFFRDRLTRQSMGSGLLLTAWRGTRPVGIGMRLIKAAERRLRKLGYDRVAVAVDVTNRNAVRLCARLGYLEWPRSPITCPRAHGSRWAAGICRVLVKVLRG